MTLIVKSQLALSLLFCSFLQTPRPGTCEGYQDPSGDNHPNAGGWQSGVREEGCVTLLKNLLFKNKRQKTAFVKKE